VEEAFKTNKLFEASGTKLADVQPGDADTFTFGLKVQLKNTMQTL
jgi:hypothetical protein